MRWDFSVKERRFRKKRRAMTEIGWDLRVTFSVRASQRLEKVLVYCAGIPRRREFGRKENIQVEPTAFCKDKFKGVTKWESRSIRSDFVPIIVVFLFIVQCITGP
jgi:hypothetical protein